MFILMFWLLKVLMVSEDTILEEIDNKSSKDKSKRL